MKLPEKVTLKDNTFYKKEIEESWMETLEDSHARAMKIAKYMSQKVSDLAIEDGVVKDGHNRICYILCSHGMNIEQMGNMLDVTDTADKFFPTPMKPDVTKANQGDDVRMVDAVKHMDWKDSGDIRYCCFNNFAVKVEPFTGDLSDYRVLEVKSNNVLNENDRVKSKV